MTFILRLCTFYVSVVFVQGHLRMNGGEGLASSDRLGVGWAHNNGSEAKLDRGSDQADARPTTSVVSEPYVAICISGELRTLPEIERYIYKQYQGLNAEYFMVTDLAYLEQRKTRNKVTGRDEVLAYRHDQYVTQVSPHVYFHERKSKHQTFSDCRDVIQQFERRQHKMFDWVIRQRTDVLGCTPPPVSAWRQHARPRTILVPDAGCRGFNRGPWVGDVWALFTRDLLDTFEFHGTKPPENELYQTLRTLPNVNIWYGGRYCSKIVHSEKLRYLRLERELNYTLAPIDFTKKLKCRAKG